MQFQFFFFFNEWMTQLNIFVSIASHLGLVWKSEVLDHIYAEI